MTTPVRVALFFEGTFLPERDGASTRFAQLPAALVNADIDVCVFHAFRGWSDLNRIAAEPYRTYFLPPHRYYYDHTLVARLLRSEGVNIIQMNDVETILNVGLPLAAATGARLVYEAHYHTTTLASQLGHSRRELVTLASLDRHVAQVVDEIIVFTDADRQRWTGLAPNGHVSIVPFGVPGASIVTRPWVGLPSLVFLGNGFFEPNARAIAHIARHLWPEFRRLRPDASCLVVGPVPPDLRRLCESVGIHATGEVPEPAALLPLCAIGLAPVLAGSGIRVKLLHYLAAGLAAVSTSVASEGLAAPALHVEDRLDHYPSTIQQLLLDKDRVELQVSETLTLLRHKHTWASIAATAADTYHRVLRRPVRARRIPRRRLARIPMWLDEALRSGRFAGSDDLTHLNYTFGVAADGRVQFF